MKQYINNFLKYRSLLYELAARDVKIKYRKSVLGIFWSILNPLLMMTIMSIVFSNLFKFDVENYPVYILSGQVIFNFFNEATSGCLTAILGNSALIKKVYIPKYLFVLSRITSSLINLLSTFCALIIVMICTRSELHYTTFLVPIPLIFLSIFSLGIGLILAAATVKFRDVMHFYSVFTTGLMYLTPVIYPIESLPSPIYEIVRINPLTSMLMMFRNAIKYDAMPGTLNLVIAAVSAFSALIIGLYVFYKQQDTFILNI